MTDLDTPRLDIARPFPLPSFRRPHGRTRLRSRRGPTAAPVPQAATPMPTQAPVQAAPRTASPAWVRHPHRFAAAAAAELEGAHPVDVLRWAGETFGDRFCVTSSMADAVLATLASDVVPGVDVVFLDTGYHFAETIQTRDRVAAELPVRVVDVKPELTVAEQNIQFGQSLYARDPDNCCAMRKVEPLGRILAGYHAWASGIRRDEGGSRAATPVVDVDRRGKIKVSPLATWTKDEVDAFVAERGVIVNPLVDRGFLSIGCAPCTRAVRPGEDARSGRWSGREKTECGLHG